VPDAFLVDHVFYEGGTQSVGSAARNDCADSRGSGTCLAVLVDRLADRFDTAPALLSKNESLTYRALAERSNQYARWALKQGLCFGDVVCCSCRIARSILPSGLG
jgi:non-ribosomal peptide synthetase component F